jgi:hypothetical protein
LYFSDRQTHEQVQKARGGGVAGNENVPAMLVNESAEGDQMRILHVAGAVIFKSNTKGNKSS